MCECIRKYITTYEYFNDLIVEVMKKFTQVTLLLEVHTYRPQWLGPIVQNKKKRLKYSATTQITHDWGTYLSESSSYYYLMATGGWNPWKKIRVVVLLLLFFKVALLEFFFSKCSKKPTVKSVLQIFLLHDWYGELLMFHSRGSFKWQWMFLVLPKKFTLLKIIQNCHSNIFKQLRYIIFKQIQKVQNIEY